MPTDPTASELPEALDLASAMPSLLVEARRITATIIAGWHGRRRAGPGEAFWQFRPFASGESAAMIDWRRSAQDDHLYVREKEWEAAHTVWLSPDLSGSMAFRSRLSAVDKRARAVVLTLALADLLARGGERAGLLGHGRPVLSRKAAEKIAKGILSTTVEPESLELRRYDDLIILGDFLDPMETIEARLEGIAAAGARAHLVQILDPIEETFPFTGRTELTDPETGFRHIVGRAERVKLGYQRLLDERRGRLRETCRRLGWSLLIHRTDRPAIEPLLALHNRLAKRTNAHPVSGKAA